VRRRQARRSRELLDRAQQEEAVLGRSREQARPGHRSERDGVEQLRVVVEPVAAIRIRPRPVEDVFAVRMVLEVERAGGDEIAVSFDDEEVR